jgi:outer membrane protein OmpA-like peptidoglycan-associated protein
MTKSIQSVLLSSAAALLLATSAAAQAQPQAQYSADDLIKAFAAQPAAQAAADEAPGGACAAKGMVAGEDGVCEPGKDSRGFSLPTRASAQDAAKGDTRGFSLPTRSQDTRGFSLPTKKATAKPAAAPAKAPPKATASRNKTSRVASATRAAPPASTAMRRDLLISFEPGSAQLTQQAQANAKVFAEALTSPQLASLRFEIQGHTDASGSREQNLLLSQRRADAVRAYLISLGVDAQRLESRGYGFEQLAAPSNPRSPENRRVEASRLN